MERKFLSGAVIADSTLGERQIRVVASDATVDRVKDIMVPKGCVLDGYAKNDIVLADHDPKMPIGNAKVGITPEQVEALITFADKGISAKADEYCALYKTGVLKAVSVGFQPIEYEPIKDGGVRYTKWALMELSCVAVPANPNAITYERSMPETTTKTASWKVGASRNLPIDADATWDGTAAEKSIFEHCGFDGDKPNTALARKAFLVYDAANPKEKSSYKGLFAKMTGGRLTAVAAGIRAAASKLSATDVSDDLKKTARAVIEHYAAKNDESAPAVRTKTIEHGVNGKLKIKGLYDCAELARVLMHLGFIHSGAEWEAEVEADGSKLPAMLAGVMRDCAEALVAMTQEEVNELLDGHGIEVFPFDVDYVEAAATPQAKALRAAFRKAGRVLSQANMDHLNEIGKCLKGMSDCHEKAAELHDYLHDNLVDMMDHGTSAGDHLKAMLKSAKPKNDDDDDDDENEDDVSDPSNSDQELAADVAVRKRQVELLERSIAS
jgi:HK97 family phage prohead protease